MNTLYISHSGLCATLFEGDFDRLFVTTIEFCDGWQVLVPAQYDEPLNSNGAVLSEGHWSRNPTAAKTFDTLEEALSAYAEHRHLVESEREAFVDTLACSWFTTVHGCDDLVCDAPSLEALVEAMAVAGEEVRHGRL